MPISKIIFCSRVLRLFVFLRSTETPQTAKCCLEWLGRLKCLATGLDAFWSSFSTLRRCSRNRSPSGLPVSPMYNSLQKVQVMQYMTLAEVQVKWSVILIDISWVPILSQRCEWKRHVLHCARAHLKVPGCSVVWNTLLTKMLRMFYSRLNKINGGCEKILPVSGSFWSNLKFFRMIDFTAWLWGWNVRVNGILSLFSLCDVCSADCRAIIAPSILIDVSDHLPNSVKLYKIIGLFAFQSITFIKWISSDWWA